jgi:hypothetical protein
MKRLLDELDPNLSALTELVASAERHPSSPFAKRHVQSRLVRALEGKARSVGGRLLRPALLGAGALLIAATAAAAGYTYLVSSSRTPPAASAVVAPPNAHAARPSSHAAPQVIAAPLEPAPIVEAPSPKHLDKARPGEDPSQVAEAVRALRKQGDAARAQALLDQYLRANPHGALAEDALALSIEAAAARKDPRAADYARRYLSRYPNGRFKTVAERALGR